MKQYYLSYALLILTLLYSCKNDENAPENNEALFFINDKNIDVNTLGRETDTAEINNRLAYVKSLKNIDNAKSILFQCIYHSHKLKYHNGLASAYNHLGVIYGIDRNVDTALLSFYKALFYTTLEPGLLILKANIYNNIGSLYFNISQFDSACFYLYRAVNLVEQKKLPQKLYDKDDRIYYDLASYWLKFGEYNKAQHFLNKSKEIASLRKDSARLHQLSILTATAYYFKHSYDTALLLFKKALEYPQVDTSEKLGLIASLGATYLNKLEPEKALPYCDSAYQMAKRQGKEDIILRAYLRLGQTYFMLGRYNGLEGLFTEVIRLATKLKMSDELELSYQYLAAINDKKGNYKAASILRDSLVALWREKYGAEKTKIIGQVDAQYRVAEKEKQLLQKQLQLNQQRNQLKEKNLWIGGITASSLLLLTLLGSMYRGNKRRRRMHEQQLQVLQHQQQIAQLQAVMHGEEQERTRLARELHDGVGGMLAAIKMNLSTDHNGEGSQQARLDSVMLMVEKTAKEVWKTAHNLMPDILNQYSFPEALAMYRDTINSGKDLQIDLQFHTEWQQLNASFELSLYRVLQELIQNIVKHAHATHVMIQFRKDELLHITVDDDGVGFDINNIKPGLGLKNIHSRVAAFNGIVSIESIPGKGTICYIEVNPEEHKKRTFDENTNKYSG